jgi:triosephosphate isomerase (TIM)
MRKPLVAGNWKMNGTRDGVKTLLEGIKAGAAQVQGADLVVCAPFVHLHEVQSLLSGSSIAWGAQDLSVHDAGAYTGEVSGPMLKEFGCRYVIIGHSERRTYHRESDELVAQKFQAALRHGLTPIFCLGETLEEREQGVTEAVVARQLDAVLEGLGADTLAQGVIAYEPVWAIGTGKTASPEQAQEVHAFIRNRVAAKDPAVATGVRILYGGSMKPDNAAELMAKPDIDGGLIGGAALKATDFLGIGLAA